MTAVSFCLLSDSVINDPVQWLLRVAETADLVEEQREAVDESPSFVKSYSQSPKV